MIGDVNPKPARLLCFPVPRPGVCRSVLEPIPLVRHHKLPGLVSPGAVTHRQLLDQAVGPEFSPLVGGTSDQESSEAPEGQKTEEDMGLMKKTVYLGPPLPGQGPTR